MTIERLRFSLNTEKKQRIKSTKSTYQHDFRDRKELVGARTIFNPEDVYLLLITKLSQF